VGELLGVLTPIAFLDAGSIIPVAILPMALFLATSRPYLTSTGYAAGIFLPYVGFGVVVAFGLGWIMDAVGAWFARFYAAPNVLELVVQIIVGLAALWFGAQMLRGATVPSASQTAAPEMSPADAFALGAGTVLVGMPGALPYFAAIDQILRADLDPGSNVIALLYYNAVILLPLLTMMLLHALMGRASRPLFESIAAFATHWGPRAFAVLLVVLGVVLFVDGVSFLAFDQPLLPSG